MNAAPLSPVSALDRKTRSRRATPVDNTTETGNQVKAVRNHLLCYHRGSPYGTDLTLHGWTEWAQNSGWVGHNAFGPTNNWSVCLLILALRSVNSEQLWLEETRCVPGSPQCSPWVSWIRQSSADAPRRPASVSNKRKCVHIRTDSKSL